MKSLKVSIISMLLILLALTLNLNAQEIASIELGEAITKTVQVCGVFKEDRSVWIFEPGDYDHVENIIVSEDAKNFDQIEVGDLINITYYEAIALSLNAPGELPDEKEETVIMRAAEGAKAGGVAMQVYNISAIVTAYNPKTKIVTLMGPKGNTITTEVEGRLVDPSTIKVGQTLNLKYAQTMIVELEKKEK